MVLLTHYTRRPFKTAWSLLILFASHPPDNGRLSTVLSRRSCRGRPLRLPGDRRIARDPFSLGCHRQPRIPSSLPCRTQRRSWKRRVGFIDIDLALRWLTATPCWRAGTVASPYGGNTRGTDRRGGPPCPRFLPDPTFTKAASAWLNKFRIGYRRTIPGPLPHGRGSEDSANKPLPGQTDDRMVLRERAFQITRTFVTKH